MTRRPNVKQWLPEEIKKLEQLLDANASATRAAAALGRTIISVQTQARKIGRPFPPRRLLKKARLAKEAEATSRQ